MPLKFVEKFCACSISSNLKNGYSKVCFVYLVNLLPGKYLKDCSHNFVAISIVFKYSALDTGSHALVQK